MCKVLLYWLLGIGLFSTDSSARDSVIVTDYGYQVNSRQNAVPAVKKALEACRAKNNPILIFPPGRYDFWPQHSAERLYYESNTDVIPLRRCPILLEHFNGLTIDGQGADFIFHDRMQPITIDHCENITVTNLNIDWDIPLTAQGQVIDTGADYLDLAINILESPYIIEKGKIIFVGEGWSSELWGVMEFDQHTKLIVPGTGDESCLGKNYRLYQAKEIRPGLIRMQHAFTRKPAIGNYLVLRHSVRDHSGVFITNSKSITIAHLNMYHNAGLGILSQYAENLFFKAVHFVPNPAKQRILSGHDDGFQFSNCRGQIVVDSCRFLALMDDPINVHGTSVRIIKKINDYQLLCQFMHHQSVGFVWARPGEKVGFIENETQHTFGFRTVHSFWSINPEQFEITFTEPIPEATEVVDALENLTWVPDVWIKQSFFGSNRARGLLVTTPGKVLIENNIFESSGSAILIAGDANGWYESGGVQDVLIRNNIFRDPCLTSMYQFCEGIISIYPEIPKLDNTKPFHRNIRIENNTFYPFDYPVLYAKSVQDLTFNHNTIIRSHRFTPFHRRKHMITLEACRQIDIRGNKLQGDVLGKNISLVQTQLKEVTLAPHQNIRLD